MSEISLEVKGILDVNDPEVRKRINFVCECVDLGVDVPEEIDEFFRLKGIDINDIENEEVLVELPVKEDEIECAYYLKVSDIPKDVSIIKISVST